jgi:hypothetical protein
MKTLTNYEDHTENRIRILTASLLCHWWIFSSVHPTIGCMQEKSAKIYMSQAAIGTIFRTKGGPEQFSGVTSGFLYAATRSSLKRAY